MRGNKNKGIVKVLGIGLTAAVLSFTLTGVAENAVTGAVSGKSVSDGLRQLTALSVMLAVPVNEFDGRDEDTVSSEPCTEKPDNETKTEKQEQQEQKVPATDNPSSSTEDTSGETLVPVDAPADVKTRLISVNIRKDKDDLTQYTAKDGTVNTATAIITFTIPGPIIATTAIARRMSGNAKRTSQHLMIRESTKPP